MISRRQFLRGDLGGGRTPLRPPWAASEEHFLTACTRCGDCVGACPEHIIVLERGYPVIDFSRTACTFCGACADACTPKALNRSGDAPPWRIRAQIGPGCVAHHDVVCRSCGDACAALAIRFVPRLGGAARPEVDAARCTGCGACVAPCPSNAIRVT